MDLDSIRLDSIRFGWTRFGFGCPEKARSLEILTVLLRQPLVAGSYHVASLVRCETNDKEKTAAIAEAEARITDLTSTIEELTATSARLNTEIKNLEAEIAKNQEASVVGTKFTTSHTASAPFHQRQNSFAS